MAHVKIPTDTIEELEVRVKKGNNGRFVCTVKAKPTGASGPAKTYSVTSDVSLPAVLQGVAYELKRT